MPNQSTEWIEEWARTNGLSPLPRGRTRDWEVLFANRLLTRLHVGFQQIRESGTDPTESLGDPEQLADRIAATAPLEPSPLEELTGPFYDTAGLRAWLGGVSRQALLDRVKARTLLGMQTRDRSWVYSAWQFANDGQTIPHLAEVLRALAAGIDDPWTWALWLQAPDEDLDGMTSAQWLNAGYDPAPVLAEARADAAHWAA